MRISRRYVHVSKLRYANLSPTCNTDYEPTQTDTTPSQLALVPVRPNQSSLLRPFAKSSAATARDNATSGAANKPASADSRQLLGGRDDDIDLRSTSNRSLRLDLGGGSLTSRATSGSIVPSLATIGGAPTKKAAAGLIGPATGAGSLTAKAAAGGAGGRGAAAPAGSGAAAPGSGRAYLAQDNERHKRKLAKARERRATLILGLIMAAFVCSWMPFFSFYVLRAVCHTCRDYISPRFEAFIFWMGYCNSAINPIIYTIFNRDFRKAFRKILFKCL